MTSMILLAKVFSKTYMLVSGDDMGVNSVAGDSAFCFDSGTVGIVYEHKRIPINTRNREMERLIESRRAYHVGLHDLAGRKERKG